MAVLVTSSPEQQTKAVVPEPWLLILPAGDQAPQLRFPAGLRLESEQLRRWPEAGSSLLLEGYCFDSQHQPYDPEELSRRLRDSGPGLLASTSGAYLLLAWDPQERKLLAARDPLGLHPAYYCGNGERLLISSRLQLLVDQPEVRARIDRPALARYLLDRQGSAPPWECYFSGIRRLRLGHWLESSRGRLREDRYWTGLPEDFQWATGEELSQVPERLGRAVRSHLEAGADCLALSGGLDSTSLAALAAEVRAEPPLTAVCLRFPGALDESETQRSVSAHLGMPVLWGELTDFLRNESLLETTWEQSRDSPGPVLSLWQGVYRWVLRLARRQGLKGLILGTGGDELFSVDPMAAADLLPGLQVRSLRRLFLAYRRASVAGWRELARELAWRNGAKPWLTNLAGRGLHSVHPKLLGALRRRRWAKLPSWFGKSDPELLRELLDRGPAFLAPPPQPPFYPRVLRSLLDSPQLAQEMEQGFAWARADDFRLYLPFYDRALVELALRARPDDLLANGASKAPLRQVLRRHYPFPLPTRKVDFTPLGIRVLRQEGPGWWARTDRAEALASLQLIDTTAADRYLQAFFEGRHDHWLPVWLLLSSELWLRRWSGQ